MQLKPETIEKIEKHKEVIQGYGKNIQNQISVLVKDTRKAYEYCRRELPEVVNIYSLKYCDTCTTCGGIFYHEDLKKGQNGSKCCTLCS